MVLSEELKSVICISISVQVLLPNGVPGTVNGASQVTMFYPVWSWSPNLKFNVS